jgi:hypothetical protein
VVNIVKTILQLSKLEKVSEIIFDTLNFKIIEIFLGAYGYVKVSLQLLNKLKKIQSSMKR